MTYPRPKPRGTNANWPAFYGVVLFDALLGVVAIFAWPSDFHVSTVWRFVAGAGVGVLFESVIVLPIVGYFVMRGNRRNK